MKTPTNGILTRGLIRAVTQAESGASAPAPRVVSLEIRMQLDLVDDSELCCTLRS